MLSVIVACYRAPRSVEYILEFGKSGSGKMHQKALIERYMSSSQKMG